MHKYISAMEEAKNRRAGNRKRTHRGISPPLEKGNHMQTPPPESHRKGANREDKKEFVECLVLIRDWKPEVFGRHES